MPGSVQALSENGLVKFGVLLGKTVPLIPVYVPLCNRLRVLSGVLFVSLCLALVLADLVSDVFLLQSNRVGPAMTQGAGCYETDPKAPVTLRRAWTARDLP